MRRVITAERVDWRDKARDLGFVFHSPGGETYWDERAYWALTLEQIERDLEAPTAELDGLCLELASRAVNDEVLLERLGLPRLGRHPAELAGGLAVALWAHGSRLRRERSRQASRIQCGHPNGALRGGGLPMALAGGHDRRLPSARGRGPVQ